MKMQKSSSLLASRFAIVILVVVVVNAVVADGTDLRADGDVTGW